MRTQKNYDMTKGNPASSLIVFSLPLIAGSICQQLYNTADYIFVGNLVGKNAAAAVGASSILVTCLIGLFTGIAVGASVAVAQCVGAGDQKQTDRLGHTALLFSFLLGIVMTVVGICISRPVLVLLNTPDTIMDEAVSYVQLYFTGMLPMVIYNVTSGILRACGDSRTPFYMLAGGGIMNVCLDALMIGPLGWGVEGAAIATTIAQGASAIAMLLVLAKGNEHFKMEPGKLRMDGHALKKILINGLPAGIQSMVITLSNMIVQYHINGFGTDAVAAFSTYFKLESFIYLPAQAMGQAVTTFVGQNMGAGKYDRVKKGTLTAAGICAGVVATFAFFLLAIGHTSLSWFVNDEAVIALGLQVISVSFPFYWMSALMEVFSGAVRGLGKAFICMIISLVTVCGMRIILLTILDRTFHTVGALTAVYPITWTLAVICLVISWRRLLKGK